MKVFVTGRDGQVARALLEAGEREAIEVVPAGRPLLDLRDDRSVNKAIAAHRPDVVINAAAYTQVDQAESDEVAPYAVNADGAAHVARACASHDIPLVHISTDYVFDGAKAQPYRETDPTAPLNAYGRSKLAGERAVAELCRKHLIVRTSWVYSPWGSNFVLTMLRLAATRPSLDVVDDQHGNPTYAPHLADALLAMAQRAATDPAQTRWGIYHATGQGETTWCGFAGEVFRHAAGHGLPAAAVAPIGASHYPTPARRPLNSRLDCGALREQFAIALPNWQTGVRDCVARIAADRAAASGQPGVIQRIDGSDAT